jgi:hypothetical protein
MNNVLLHLDVGGHFQPIGTMDVKVEGLRDLAFTFEQLLDLSTYYSYSYLFFPRH